LAYTTQSVPRSSSIHPAIRPAQDRDGQLLGLEVARDQLKDGVEVFDEPVVRHRQVVEGVFADVYGEVRHDHLLPRQRLDGLILPGAVVVQPPERSRAAVRLQHLWLVGVNDAVSPHGEQRRCLRLVERVDPLHVGLEELLAVRGRRQVLAVGRPEDESGQVLDVGEELPRDAEGPVHRDERADVRLDGPLHVVAEVANPVGVSPGFLRERHRRSPCKGHQLSHEEMAQGSRTHRNVPADRVTARSRSVD
jgi:hypothetical protein